MWIEKRKINESNQYSVCNRNFGVIFVVSLSPCPVRFCVAILTLKLLSKYFMKVLTYVSNRNAEFIYSLLLLFIARNAHFFFSFLLFVILYLFTATKYFNKVFFIIFSLTVARLFFIELYLLLVENENFFLCLNRS